MDSRPSRPGPSVPPGAAKAAAALFGQAFARHQAGDLAEAERLYRRALTSDPRHADSLHLLGLVCARTGRADDAIALIGEAVRLRPDFDLAHYNLGNVLSRVGRAEEAVQAYRRAVAIRPDTPTVLVNLGAALRGLGRSAEAVEAYRRALARDPRSAAAHYNLGVALQDLGRDEDAAQAFRHAVSLQPGDADAWANLGAVLLSLGRTGEAAAAQRRRLALEPESAEAHAALAAALLSLGRIDEAVEFSKRAVDLRPEEMGAHLLLGNGLREQGHAAEAIEAYQRAVALDPGAAGPWVNLAIGLQERGDADEAAAAIDRALDIDPASAAAWSVRGGLKTFGAGDTDIDRLRELLAASPEGAGHAEDRIELEFTLGKAFMDLGDADAAFGHLNSANRLRRARLSYDVRQDVAQFEQIARSLDAPRLASLAGGGHSSDAPVFILGMPRSGTTLVEQILASHPLVHGAGELTTLEEILIDRLGESLSPIERAVRMADLTPDDLAAMGAGYTSKLTPQAPHARRVTDKMPANFRLAGLIRLILPNARIIHCRRDPRDTGLSCYARKFSRGQDFTYDLRDFGLYYRAYETLMAHWRALMPADRFIDVAYEEVVADLETQARRLIAFLGLDWDEACLGFHQTRRPIRTASVHQVRQPLYRSSLARWKAYEAHLGPLIDALRPSQRTPL